MTAKRKALLLNIAGAVVSFAVPAAATIAEFPYIRAKVASGSSFADTLHISAAALAIIVILASVTLFRFFRDRIKVPRSGLLVSVALLAVFYAVEMFIHALVVIMFWCSIGSAVGLVLFTIADKIYDKEKDE